MKLGRHFTLDEMTATNTGLPNRPNDWQLVNLTRIVSLCLAPLRNDCGALRVTSGFRSEAVNKAVGGSDKSYHRHALAVDFRSSDYSVEELVDRIEMLNLPFDKLIMEYGGGKPWVHWQIAEADRTNRREVYTAKMVDGKMKYTRVM